MIRLTILTLIGLFAVMVLMGEPDPNASARAQSDAEINDIAEPETTAEPVVQQASAEAPAEPAPAADEVQQTPEQVQDFPGPALRPSPEYAGQADAAEAEQLAASGAQILYVTGNRVNFRAGPSTNDRVIGALLQGSPVESLGQTDGGWVQLRDAQGREGYMSADFLSPERPN